jgi:hypothetical protein
VGAGRSLEVAYDLKASIPSGTYHFVLDCIVISPVDMTFELIWRHGGSDTTLAMWQQHFMPQTVGFDAQAYEIDQNGAAIDMTSGDQLVFRYSAMNTSQAEAWIPNGDGKISHGRIPHIVLPK